MAVKTKPSGYTPKVNDFVHEVDADGDNFIGTVPAGFRGATVMVNVNSGTATSFTLAKLSNDGSTIVSYEDGAITATGGDKAVNSGEVDLYLVVAGASSLNADVEIDCFR